MTSALPDPPVRFLIGNERRLALLVAVALCAAAFQGGMDDLLTRWHRQPEYSHGFLIPVISAWLLWTRREAMAASWGSPSWWGITVIVTATGMLIVGELTAIFILMQWGFLMALAGLVLAFGGLPLLRVVAVPIALLAFSIPLPYFVDAQLSWRLQIVSSQFGVGVLRALGFAVYLEGNVIDLGIYKLQVVEACSGLRYLYPLLSVSFLMAYMYPALLRWRVLLFISAVPVAVLTNSLRIAIVGLLVERYGIGMAEGFLHAFEGWIIFVICIAVLLGEIAVIERLTRRRRLAELMVLPTVQASRPQQALVPTAWPWRIAVGALTAAFAATWVTGGRLEQVPTRSSLRSFPSALGPWRSSESSLPPEIEKYLGVSDYLLADYSGPEGGLVNLYVAYYASQRKGVSPHSPQVCIPGGGWVISELAKSQIAMPGGGLETVRVQISRGNRRALVYYWFEQRGRQLSNEYFTKWYLLVDSILRNRTDGALVRVVTLIDEGETAATADQRIQKFIVRAAPELPPFVPH